MRWALLLSLFPLTAFQDTDPGLIIRSTTSIVQVRVVVQDAKGNFVRDLTRDSFQLQDDRKPQPITLFVEEKGTVPLPTAGVLPRRTDSVQPANEYSLLLLDWLNTSYGDRVFAQDKVLKLLKTYQPRQKVAVYLLGRDPRLLCDFTTDTELLRQVIEDAGFEPEDMGPATEIGHFDARFGARAGPRPTVEEQIFFWNNRVNDSFQNLQVLADRMARLPGRKSLVWVSSAFPLMINGSVIPGAKPAEVSYLPNFDRLLAKLNRADVAVYPVDAIGLSLTSRSFQGTMRQIAERTGGVAFVARNDLDEGIRVAMEDMRVSYVLGFHVPQGAAPGQHEIRVKVNRAHLTLRYRESYQLEESVRPK